MYELSEFFNDSDGMTLRGSLHNAGIDLNGYFDNVETEFYLNHSQGPINAQFVCEDYTGSAGAVGDIISINNISYRVIKAEPDGTGILTLYLFK